MWFFALIVVVLIGAVAVVASGRWGAMSTAYDDRPDMSVPARQALTSDDIETARFGVGLRGYRMDEVDTLLERVAREVAERDRRIADLERAVTPIMHGPEGAGFASRHTYDADDFDDTGYQLPILVGGDFPAETTPAPTPPPQPEQPAKPETAQAPEPQAAQAVEPEVAQASEPAAAQASEPQLAQASEPEVPPAAAQPVAAAEPHQTPEPDARQAGEPSVPPAAAQPVAAVEPQQTPEPEAPQTAEPEFRREAQPVAETLAPAAPAPEFAASRTPQPDAPQASEQADPHVAQPEVPAVAEPEVPVAAELEVPPAAQPEDPQVAEPDVRAAAQASVLEAPLPPVPPEPVLEQPEEAQEQAAWWPAAESAGARPAAAAQDASRSGQLWADPGAADVHGSNGQPEQASPVDQPGGENGQASDQAPRGRHSAAPDAGAYQRPS